MKILPNTQYRLTLSNRDGNGDNLCRIIAWNYNKIIGLSTPLLIPQNGEYLIRKYRSMDEIILAGHFYAFHTNEDTINYILFDV